MGIVTIVALAPAQPPLLWNNALEAVEGACLTPPRSELEEEDMVLGKRLRQAAGEKKGTNSTQI